MSETPAIVALRIGLLAPVAQPRPLYGAIKALMLSPKAVCEPPRSSVAVQPEGWTRLQTD